MGTKLKDIIFDRHEDHLYEDERAMRLTPYVMAERCLQGGMKNIYEDYGKGDFDTLSYILSGGFKGFHNMDSSELIDEYKAIEDRWYQLESDGELPFEAYEDDPIHTLKETV